MDGLGVLVEAQRKTGMETPEQKSKRNDYVKHRVLLRIKDGGVNHEAWVTRHVGLPDMQEPIAPVVEISNDDDGHYVQAFRSRAELDAFVSRILAVADEAWPASKTPNVCVERRTEVGRV